MIAEEARRALAGSPRWIPSKYHYDARGSEIFERITRLPEYYPTRTEHRILEATADDIVDDVRPRVLVEYGSGSASKTRVLLDAMQRAGSLEGYGAIEVSETALRNSAADLIDRYPTLCFEGVIADFETQVDMPFSGIPRLIVFLGSTIGNFAPAEASRVLRGISRRMGPDDALLIGLDLVKEASVLEAAYNDREGVSQEFSRNLLMVLNRELDGNFNPEDFRHIATFDAGQSRIQANLVAQRPVNARLRAIDLDLELLEGDAIRAEYSHKYTRGSFDEIASGAGLEVARWDTDEANYCALALTRLPRI